MPIGNVQEYVECPRGQLRTCDVRGKGESSGTEEYERLRRLLCVKEYIEPRTKDDSAIRDSSWAGR